MPIRTIAEAVYIIASAGVTYAVTLLAMWGYPQGRHTIWIVGLVSTAIVALMGVKPLIDAWKIERGARAHV